MAYVCRNTWGVWYQKHYFSDRRVPGIRFEFCRRCGLENPYPMTEAERIAGTVPLVRAPHTSARTRRMLRAAQASRRWARR